MSRVTSTVLGAAAAAGTGLAIDAFVLGAQAPSSAGSPQPSVLRGAAVIAGVASPGKSGACQSVAWLGSAAALAVVLHSRRSTRGRSALRAEPVGADFNPAVQVGATQPLGFFDPLGFCKSGDEEGFRKFRTAEIKHGRVAMMAAAGAVVQHYVKFTGFEKVPSGLDAVNTPPGSYGFVALFVLAGALELAIWTESPNEAPGNFGDPFGLGQYNEDMRNRELNNGRAAMFAAIGIIAAELFTGKDGVEQILSK